MLVPDVANTAGIDRDLRTILVIQAIRAFLYGLGSVLIGLTLAAGGLSDGEVGLVFTAILVGMALGTLVVGTVGERVGRRRTYVAVLLLVAASGTVFAVTLSVPALVAAALTGAMSTDPNESGPITSLEQAMIGEAPPEARLTVFGRYNAIAFLAGAVGALAAAAPGVLDVGEQQFLLTYPVLAILAAVLAARMSPAVEAHREAQTAQDGPRMARRPPLTRSRSIVLRLASLFALDSFAGGFIVQSFVVYWFARTFIVSTEVMGLVFFVSGLLQAGSSIAASRIAARFGLLNTMVFTHLPSNVLLILVPFAPALAPAVMIWLARVAISQMDVPARQAYVVALVDSDERVAATAYTNTARYLARPIGPAVAGSLMQSAAAAPFFIAGGLKIVYDVLIYITFRSVRAPTEPIAKPAIVTRR